MYIRPLDPHEIDALPNAASVRATIEGATRDIEDTLEETINQEVKDLEDDMDKLERELRDAENELDKTTREHDELCDDAMELAEHVIKALTEHGAQDWDIAKEVQWFLDRNS